QDLEQVVLDDVADRPGVVVELSAPLDAELLGHGDLHRVDVVAIPDRLEERVGEAEEEQVLDRVLAEVVVDAEDGFLGEDRVDRRVELPGRGDVAAEGFLDDHAGAFGAPRLAESLDDVAEEKGRDREVVRRVLRGAERLPEDGEGRGIAVVSIDVLEPREELPEGLLVHASAVLVDARLRALAQLFERPSRLRDADDGHAQVPVHRHVLERREDLLVSEVSRGAEEDEGVGGDRSVVRHAGSRAQCSRALGTSPGDAMTALGGAQASVTPGTPLKIQLLGAMAASAGAGAGAGRSLTTVTEPPPSIGRLPIALAPRSCRWILKASSPATFVTFLTSACRRAISVP